MPDSRRHSNNQMHALASSAAKPHTHTHVSVAVPQLNYTTARPAPHRRTECRAGVKCARMQAAIRNGDVVDVDDGGGNDDGGNDDDHDDNTDATTMPRRGDATRQRGNSNGWMDGRMDVRACVCIFVCALVRGM